MYVLLRHIDRRADFGAAEVPDCCLYLLYIRLSLIVGYEYMKTNALLMPFKLKIEQEYPVTNPKVDNYTEVSRKLKFNGPIYQ